MEGFEGFRDFPDYILGVTHQIWEGRNIASLNRWYAPDIVVRTPGGVAVGNVDTIAATMGVLAEFPDRELLGEDVIWSGDPQAGMLSSHRILSTATHAGGAYGPATGRRVTYRAMADCHARGGVIDDEWLIRDQAAVLRQLGRDPVEHARTLAASGAQPLTPATDRPGPYRGRGNDSDWGARLADLLSRIMAADFAAIPAEYDRAAELAYPGGLVGHGTGVADRFWLGLRAAFPSAAFEVHHVIGRDDALMPPRAAVRWSLHGAHDGWGAFGRPTGAEVYVLGITHAESGPWGLRREWTLYDETAVWTQILAATGDFEEETKDG